jgi:hypothetical protein
MRHSSLYSHGTILGIFAAAATTLVLAEFSYPIKATVAMTDSPHGPVIKIGVNQSGEYPNPLNRAPQESVTYLHTNATNGQDTEGHRIVCGKTYQFTVNNPSLWQCIFSHDETVLEPHVVKAVHVPNPSNRNDPEHFKAPALPKLTN